MNQRFYIDRCACLADEKFVSGRLRQYVYYLMLYLAALLRLAKIYQSYAKERMTVHNRLIYFL
jgi:hypothetical protein